MMKKVAIAAVHWKHNHGSMLQALALQQALTELGVVNEIIDMTGLHSEIRKNRMPFYLRQVFSPSFLATKIGKIKYELLYKKRVNGLDIRKKRFTEFEDRLTLSTQYKSMAKLAKACEEYSHVMVGSDQLWLPINIAGNYYTLNFVPYNIPKISYATSFGVAQITKTYHEKYRHFLKRITHLSVREESGKQLIKSLIGKDAQEVCDPTMLFDQHGWTSLIPNKQNKLTDYIFCYFLGGNKHHREFANALKQRTGLPIVAMVHMEEYHYCDNNFADHAITDAGPEEFVNLIRGASYVCTDSYHGTVFSLIHSKEFWTLKRHSDNSAMSTNTRIESLLASLGLNDRYSAAEKTVTNNIIDYSFVHACLQQKRNKALDFLKNSLDVQE